RHSGAACARRQHGPRTPSLIPIIFQNNRVIIGSMEISVACQIHSLPQERCFLVPPSGPPAEERPSRRPRGHRPGHARSVFAPRRTVIVVDLAAPRALLPVPLIARVLWRPLELLLSDSGAVSP